MPELNVKVELLFVVYDITDCVLDAPVGPVGPCDPPPPAPAVFRNVPSEKTIPLMVLLLVIYRFP